MKKTTVLTALLAVLAVTAGLLWPGRVLARRERRLYGQIVTGAAAVSAFERGETTLAQRIAVLGSINNTVPAMDFSAGAQLYDDEYTLRRRFVRELRQMGKFFAPASTLEAWLVETEMATQEFHEIPVSYRCAVDPDSGKTFLVGTLQDLNWEQFLLYMDMSSGKIIRAGFSPPAWPTTWASPPSPAWSQTRPAACICLKARTRSRCAIPSIWKRRCGGYTPPHDP